MNDYKATFIDAVDELIAQNIEDRTERMSSVHALTDAYIDSVGKPPDAAQVERLADYILREELTDTHPDKLTRAEYPFMSEWQINLRHDRETSLKSAEETGTDGRDYRVPKRRKRSGYENYFVDKNAKIRNVARAAQYKRDTSPGPIVPYMTEPFVNCRGIGEKWRDELSLVY